MWGSAIVGDVYDAPLIVGDDFTKSVYNTLTQHPEYIHQSISARGPHFEPPAANEHGRAA